MMIQRLLVSVLSTLTVMKVKPVSARWKVPSISWKDQRNLTSLSVAMEKRPTGNNSLTDKNHSRLKCQKEKEHSLKVSTRIAQRLCFLRQGAIKTRSSANWIRDVQLWAVASHLIIWLSQMRKVPQVLALARHFKKTAWKMMEMKAKFQRISGDIALWKSCALVKY